ncbi:MAG: NADH-quinone oxidoreductase subunit A [Candidatus Hydrogenedentes bacterium]|nr:NADH-quinone oxidoreductase subunit A [Candidatus Hydrogenedentota bacterium]
MPATVEIAVFWPFFVYFGCVIVLVAGMVGVSYVLGSRHWERATGAPFESGIVTTGSARVGVPANFYLVAMLFVIFDLESVFLFAWAAVVRQVGWTGYVGACVFIVMMAAALVYLWRVGALEGR